eukprot:4442049-Alexandrium_andersonii.AAC.1
MASTSPPPANGSGPRRSSSGQPRCSLPRATLRVRPSVALASGRPLGPDCHRRQDPGRAPRPGPRRGLRHVGVFEFVLEELALASAALRGSLLRAQLPQ